MLKSIVFTNICCIGSQLLNLEVHFFLIFQLGHRYLSPVIIFAKKEKQMARKKRIGIGANCSVAHKYLHPAKTIADKYSNATAQSRVENLVCIKKETRVVKRKEQVCVIFCHDDFDDGTEIYCVKRWARVEEEGAEEHFFDQLTPPEDANNIQAPEQVVEGLEIDPDIAAATCNEDIQMVLAQGLMVDDDNQPAPKNIPQAAAPQNIGDKEWGWDGTCKRKMTGAVNHAAKIPNLTGLAIETMSYIHMFLLFFPSVFLREVILEKTNSNLQTPMTYGELLRYIGIWFIITKASPGKMPTSEFWSKSPVTRKEGAPFRLHDLMSGRRFSDITAALSFTADDPPQYKDPFWEIRSIIKAWNQNMSEKFSSAWINCLDESMSIWTSKWTCPGWIFCPRKPHPVGNEYHTICCGESGILFQIEMVEGKERPSELPSDPKTKRTAGLLLRLCKPILSAGKVIILDSGFCVLEALIALKKVGVYASALIKKRRFWPKHVPGDHIDQHFEEKNVGETDSLRGKIDDVHFDIMCMKEPDYVMKIMSTYGGLTVKPGQRE